MSDECLHIQYVLYPNIDIRALVTTTFVIITNTNEQLIITWLWLCYCQNFRMLVNIHVLLHIRLFLLLYVITKHKQPNRILYYAVYMFDVVVVVILCVTSDSFYTKIKNTVASYIL